MIHIDGSQGEGGGQVLRTSLSLSALTGRPFRMSNIRANRSKPGLRPQHLTAVRAVAALCAAQLSGDKINSAYLEFQPQSPPLGGSYHFDVTDAAPNHSAGSVTLILQAMLWPLLFAPEPSHLTLRGGTHVPFSPPYHYLEKVWLPVIAQMGVDAALTLVDWGWNPTGRGEMTAVISPISHLQPLSLTAVAANIVQGIAAVTNLPAHIPNRMARRADNLLREDGLQTAIEPKRERGPGPGAGIFLWLPQAGFSSLGRKGLPADKVAETAVADLRKFADNKTAVDRHLADQLLLPLTLAQGTSDLTTDRLTTHTLTNAKLLRQWVDTPIQLDGDPDRPAHIQVTGVNFDITHNQLT